MTKHEKRCYPTLRLQVFYLIGYFLLFLLSGILFNSYVVELRHEGQFLIILIPFTALIVATLSSCFFWRKRLSHLLLSALCAAAISILFSLKGFSNISAYSLSSLLENDQLVYSLLLTGTAALSFFILSLLFLPFDRPELERNEDLMTPIVFGVLTLLIALFVAPLYCDYTGRTHVAEGLVMASPAKFVIAEYYAKEGAFPSNNKEVGLVPAEDIKGNAVTSVEVIDQGRIIITYNGKVKQGSQLMLTPFIDEEEMDASRRIKWNCTTKIFAPKIQIDPRDLPTICRKDN